MVLTAVGIKVRVSWDVTPCISVEKRRSLRQIDLHVQGKKLEEYKYEIKKIILHNFSSV
jgi:hypothetical protein